VNAAVDKTLLNPGRLIRRYGSRSFVSMGDSPTEGGVNVCRRIHAPILLLAGALCLIGAERFFAASEKADAAPPRRPATCVLDPDREPPRRDARAPARTEPTDTPAPASSEPAPPPDPSTPVDPGSLTVTRILLDPGDPDATFAVIEGRAVRAGESVGGWPVFRVERDRVLLGVEGERVLPLAERESR
jgi:hypothetical protein